MSKFVLTLDSSQISDFLDCPTLWEYKNVKRLQPVSAGENVPMSMGSYGHKLLEIIYKCRAEGDGVSAIDQAFNYDVDKLFCRCGHGKEHHNPHVLELDDTLEKYCTIVGCQCLDFVPVPFPLSAPNRERVKNRVLEYTFCEGTAFPTLVPKSPDHIEVGFSHKLYEDESRLYILEGRIDLLGKIASNCENGWADHKFQIRERDLYLKSIQFRNYSMVTDLSIGVVNYIRFAQKIEKDKTFKREIISFSRVELRNWEQQLIQIFNQVERFAKLEERRLWLSDTEIRNWGACSGKYGYKCDYTGLCEASLVNQNLVQILEKQDFKEKPIWKAW